KNGRPGTAWPRMLNSASRTMSGVGRRFGLTFQLILRPRSEPDTIRTCARMTPSDFSPAPSLLFPPAGARQAPFRGRGQPQLFAQRYGQTDPIVCSFPAATDVLPPDSAGRAGQEGPAAAQSARVLCQGWQSIFCR